MLALMKGYIYTHWWVTIFDCCTCASQLWPCSGSLHVLISLHAWLTWTHHTCVGVSPSLTLTSFPNYVTLTDVCLFARAMNLVDKVKAIPYCKLGSTWYILHCRKGRLVTKALADYPSCMHLPLVNAYSTPGTGNTNFYNAFAFPPSSTQLPFQILNCEWNSWTENIQHACMHNLIDWVNYASKSTNLFNYIRNSVCTCTHKPI